MKLLLFGMFALSCFPISPALGQVPPGNMYGRCSNIYGPIYNSSTKAYTASGTCQNGNPVNCFTDPIDGSPDYYCQSGGSKEQDPNPSVAADEVCGCIDN
ncbi:hypothetical protein FBR05_01600 [Deltaproteobacteria bacterium PRO3]|nr:hypothetical protein [Deltaproteobacteria bacterium PRO3]